MCSAAGRESRDGRNTVLFLYFTSHSRFLNLSFVSRLPPTAPRRPLPSTGSPSFLRRVFNLKSFLSESWQRPSKPLRCRIGLLLPRLLLLFLLILSSPGTCPLIFSSFSVTFSFLFSPLAIRLHEQRRDEKFGSERKSW